MKYYIFNIKSNTYFVLSSFEQMIEWFARFNKEFFQDLGLRNKQIFLNPKKHRYENYNSALNHIAMNKNDMKWSSNNCLQVKNYTIPLEKIHREIMVIDELNRVIDPREYWYQIATYQSKINYQNKHRVSFVFRYDPVPKIRKCKSRRSSYYRKPKTFQERKLSCDKKIKDFIKPKRNMMNLPNSWDNILRNKNHCWKAKKIKKQWMKH